MYCTQCGTENADGAQVCRSCGASLAVVVVPGVVTAAKTCGLATASLVFGLLTMCGGLLTAIPAIILGIVALSKIGRSQGRLGGHGLAIAGICTGGTLWLLSTPLLLGILMPALARTRQLAFRMTCGTNLSGLGKAMVIYMGDNDEQFPTPSAWCDLLIEHAGVTPQSFICKGGDEGPCHYAMNKNVIGLGMSAPPDMVLLFETYPGWNQVGGPEMLTTENHQGDGCNILFADGHVRFVRARELDTLRWTAGP